MNQFHKETVVKKWIACRLWPLYAVTLVELQADLRFICADGGASVVKASLINPLMSKYKTCKLVSYRHRMQKTDWYAILN